MTKLVRCALDPTPTVPADYSEGDTCLQSDREHTDIMKIAARARMADARETLNLLDRWGGEQLPTDYSLEEALQLSVDLDDMFHALPAALRAQYGNDPHALARALGDASERERLASEGYLSAPEGTALRASQTPETPEGPSPHDPAAPAAEPPAQAADQAAQDSAK